MLRRCGCAVAVEFTTRRLADRGACPMRSATRMVAATATPGNKGAVQRADGTTAAPSPPPPPAAVRASPANVPRVGRGRDEKAHFLMPQSRDGEFVPPPAPEVQARWLPPKARLRNIRSTRHASDMAAIHAARANAGGTLGPPLRR